MRTLQTLTTSINLLDCGTVYAVTRQLSCQVFSLILQLTSNNISLGLNLNHHESSSCSTSNSRMANSVSSTMSNSFCLPT